MSFENPRQGIAKEKIHSLSPSPPCGQQFPRYPRFWEKTILFLLVL
jgi:hypothetical protein